MYQYLQSTIYFLYIYRYYCRKIIFYLVNVPNMVFWLFYLFLTLVIVCWTNCSYKNNNCKVLIKFPILLSHFCQSIELLENKITIKNQTAYLLPYTFFITNNSNLFINWLFSISIINMKVGRAEKKNIFF